MNKNTNEVGLTPEQKSLHMELQFCSIATTYANIAKSEYETRSEKELREHYTSNNGGLYGWLADKVFNGANDEKHREILKEFEKSNEYIEAKEIKEKFTKEREFGFYKRDKKNKYDENETKASVKKWAAKQPHLKSLNENELWGKYNNREFGFKTFINFYRWYMKEPKKCYYCDITQDELKNLWKEEFNLISSKKFTRALHIERLDPDKPYCKDNCRLACAVCNNAKSDMISESDFRECFVEGIKKFYNLLKSRLKK